MILNSMVLLSAFFLWTQSAAAAPQPVASPSEVAPAATRGKKVQKEMNFEDLLVQGKYHFSDEAVTTVEEDKVLDGLIGVRTDFKDRVRQSAAQQ